MLSMFPRRLRHEKTFVTRADGTRLAVEPAYREDTPALYDVMEFYVLNALPARDSEDVAYSRYVAQGLGLPPECTLAVIRLLVQKGLAELLLAYDHDEGYPMGSGFRRTKGGDLRLRGPDKPVLRRVYVERKG